ncbi:MAG TPA: nucleotide pyrophosphohydrolase [Cyanothece sp. UBA12306]|nr:nucleotide pyrophosphohydrolase [Cyanothece sp. UBA12306]
MRQYYHKLVRDKIPEIIAQAGKSYEIKTLSEDEYLQALNNKLLEEAKEVVQAEPEDLLKELGDLFEVIDHILIAYNISRGTIINCQQKRRKERGSFTKRIQLVWTET